MGEGADAGAEHPLGDGVQPVGVQADAPGAGPVSGTALSPRYRAAAERRRLTVCALDLQAEEFHSTVHILLEWLAEAEQSLRFHGSLPDDEEALQTLIEQHKVRKANICRPAGSGRRFILSAEASPDLLSHSLFVVVNNWFRQKVTLSIKQI